MSEKLKLINGKFYRGNTEVKPEFGNVEMINLLKKAGNEESIIGDFSSEEITTYVTTVNFTCHCGCKNSEEIDEIFEDDEPSSYDLEDYEVSCSECSKVYTLKEHSDKSYIKEPISYPRKRRITLITEKEND